MNTTLKHTLIALATAALGVTAGCKSDSGPEASEATAGAEAAKMHSAEGSCGEGTCGGAGTEKMKEGASEASCGEGTCG